jgi:hypothetical protein
MLCWENNCKNVSAAKTQTTCFGASEEHPCKPPIMDCGGSVPPNDENITDFATANDAYCTTDSQACVKVKSMFGQQIECPGLHAGGKSDQPVISRNF